MLYQKIRGVVKFVRFGVKSLKKGQKNYLAPKRAAAAAEVYSGGGPQGVDSFTVGEVVYGQRLDELCGRV